MDNCCSTESCNKPLTGRSDVSKSLPYSNTKLASPVRVGKLLMEVPGTPIKRGGYKSVLTTQYRVGQILGKHTDVIIKRFFGPGREFYKMLQEK